MGALSNNAKLGKERRMIKSVISGSSYIQVSGGQSPVPYINSGIQSAGMMRYNTSSQNVEVYDGTGWQQLDGGYVSVGLNGEAESLLDWARRERDRQAKREQLIKENPALQKAWEAIKKAEDNFDILSKFVENDNVG